MTDVARWQPDARDRLEQAALALYIEHGYDQTTVTEIARRAGLTERSFFRHFADQLEVLFGGTAMLQEMLVNGIAGAPATAAPIDTLVELRAVGSGGS